MARISAFRLCLGVAAALLAAGSADAQLVGGRSLQSSTATPTSATTPATATRPTNPYAGNGMTQPDPFSIASPQGVAGATTSSLGAVSTMPATGAQAQAAGTPQPASYGAEGQPTAPPAYSIQSAPAGSPYGGPQPAPYPYNQLPQYQPQAAPPQQAPGTPQALAPAYNQIPSPYASMLARPAPAPAYAPQPGMAAQPGAMPPMPQIIEGGYTLGPGDRVKLTVFGEQDLSGEYQLDGNGNIRLPLVGVVRAAGFTAQALEMALYSALVPNYLRNPRLTVEITHYRPVYVVGAVMKPGQYDYVHDMTLLQAIALAGGFNTQAKESEVYVRREGETGEQLVPTAQPLLVRPGDTVRVDTTLFWDALNVFAPISGPAYLLK